MMSLHSSGLEYVVKHNFGKEIGENNSDECPFMCLAIDDECCRWFVLLDNINS